MSESTFDRAAIEARAKVAHDRVSDLCHGRRDWIMSIPAQPERDPDLVIGRALADLNVCLSEIDRQAQKIERNGLYLASARERFDHEMDRLTRLNTALLKVCRWELKTTIGKECHCVPANAGNCLSCRMRAAVAIAENPETLTEEETL